MKARVFEGIFLQLQEAKGERYRARKFSLERGWGSSAEVKQEVEVVMVFILRQTFVGGEK